MRQRDLLLIAAGAGASALMSIVGVSMYRTPIEKPIYLAIEDVPPGPEWEVEGKIDTLVPPSAGLAHGCGLKDFTLQLPLMTHSPATTVAPLSVSTIKSMNCWISEARKRGLRVQVVRNRHFRFGDGTQEKAIRL